MQPFKLSLFAALPVFKMTYKNKKQKNKKNLMFLNQEDEVLWIYFILNWNTAIL